jgi:hypothetical protein
LHLQISSETTDAKKRADETGEAVDNLERKLNKLQKKFLKNAHDAKEIKIQSDAVKESASDTQDKAKKVIEILCELTNLRQFCFAVEKSIQTSEWHSDNEVIFVGSRQRTSAATFATSITNHSWYQQQVERTQRWFFNLF